LNNKDATLPLYGYAMIIHHQPQPNLKAILVILLFRPQKNKTFTS